MWRRSWQCEARGASCVYPYSSRLSRYAAIFVVLCTLAASALGAPAGAVEAVPGTQEQSLDFDIPAQPLAAALQRYAVISSRPALFSSAMVAGRNSSAVQGSYTPEAALELLLEGTGLIAQKGKSGSSEAFFLKNIGTQSTAHLPPEGLNRDYGGWVQARVWEALCADTRTAPGTYRALLRFEIDASGFVHQARLLTSTGNTGRDAAVLKILRQVHVDRPPPADMAQPLTMILLPRDQEHPGNAPRCNDDGGGGS